MAYQMMKGKKGNNDGFPSVPGMIARYSALGLTNEQMAANPVWKDLTGNGHDLQMKNFAWGGMSGVGGYVDNWNSSADWDINNYWVNSHTDHKLQLITASTVVQMKSNNIYNAENVYKNILNVNGLTEAVNKGSVGGLSISATDPITSKAIKTFSFDTDGVIQISFDDVLQDYYVVYFLFGNNTNDVDITIEQLPLYPGFILGDGVDDFAVTEKELNLEDTYTVYTPLILLKYGGVVCGKNSDKDFSLNTVIYSKSIGFDSANAWSGSIPVDLFEFVLVACKRSPQTMYVKDLVTGKSNQNESKEFVPNPRKYFVWRNVGGSWCQVAIAGQIICNGYYSTDEDDEKVLDWYKKQYPWLFFDQAWTVVGKTNEDEDRATIANITGNGNNLVLSNSGFAEGSGYGLYAENYAGGRWVQSTDRADLTWTSYSVNITSVKVASTQLYYQSYPEQPSFIVPSYKIKVYGLKDGQTLSYGQATSEGQHLYKISEDGTYTLPSFPFKANGDWYGFTLNKVQESCDITIEQIPEYEGYLVTDGVDDKITSSTFEMGNDWTVIGDWELINTGKNDNAGIVKFDSIVIYNYNPILINIKNGRNHLIPDQNTVNAICSDGRIYSKDWKESIYNEETESTSKNLLTMGYSGNSYTKIAFKNLAIYPTVLSKEDCIKAYNYLQTLKAK
jgi:hypothetical protein